MLVSSGTPVCFVRRNVAKESVSARRHILPTDVADVSMINRRVTLRVINGRQVIGACVKQLGEDVPVEVETLPAGVSKRAEPFGSWSGGTRAGRAMDIRHARKG